MASNKHLNEAEIMKALRAGDTFAIIGERFDCAKSTVSYIARKNGYSAANAARVRAAERQEKKRAAKCIARGLPLPHPTPAHLLRLPSDVPPWVARAGLATDYRDDAREFGDDYAARRCRKLLADLRQQQALDARLGRVA